VTALKYWKERNFCYEEVQEDASEDDGQDEGRQEGDAHEGGQRENGSQEALGREIGLMELLGRMTDAPRLPAVLDAISDVVLRYRPKPVSDAAKDRKKRAKRVASKAKADA
jgi:hypothetical protein